MSVAPVDSSGSGRGVVSADSFGEGVGSGEPERELLDEVEVPEDVDVVSPLSVDSLVDPELDVGSSVVAPDEELDGGVGVGLEGVGDDSGDFEVLLEDGVFEELLLVAVDDGFGVDEGATWPGCTGAWSLRRGEAWGVLVACGRSDGATREDPVVDRAWVGVFDVLVDTAGLAPAGADSVPCPPEPPAADSGLPSTLPATAPSW